jgi:hypothetical protein
MESAERAKMWDGAEGNDGEVFISMGQGHEGRQV